MRSRSATKHFKSEEGSFGYSSEWPTKVTVAGRPLGHDFLPQLKRGSGADKKNTREINPEWTKHGLHSCGFVKSHSVPAATMSRTWGNQEWSGSITFFWVLPSVPLVVGACLAWENTTRLHLTPGLQCKRRKWICCTSYFPTSTRQLHLI